MSCLFIYLKTKKEFYGALKALLVLHNPFWPTTVSAIKLINKNLDGTKEFI